MKKMTPLLFCLAILLFLFGIFGLYTNTTLQTVNTMRASVQTAQKEAQNAQTALEAAKQAASQAEESAKKTNAGTDATAAKAAQDTAESTARDLKNAQKKATNKLNSYLEYSAMVAPQGSAIDSSLAAAASSMRYILLLAATVLLGLAFAKSKYNLHLFSVTAIAVGAALSVGMLLVCCMHKTIAFTYGITFTDLLLGTLVHFRGILLIIGLLILSIGLYVSPKLNSRKVVCVLFLAPTAIAFTLTIIVPFLLGIFYSMTNWTGVSMTEFVGLKNYTECFKTPEYLHSLMVTVKYTVINMILVNVVAFGLSMLVTGKVKGRNFYRAGFFVPNLIGGIVLGYIWQFIFNYVLPPFAQAIGVKFLSTSMLADSDLALAAVIVVSIWQYAGYIMMIYVAAIQGVPASILEAAEVDGASKWERMNKIMIPMIANAFTICIFLTLVNSFKQFDLNYALTNGGPAALFMDKAVNSTELLALNIYKTAFNRNMMAVGQSKAVVFFIMLVIVSLIQVSVSKRKEVEM